MRIRTSIAGLSLGLLLAACGSTQTATVTQTRTLTRTVVRHTPAHPGKGGRKSQRPSPGRSFVSTYPPKFAAKFRATCLHAGNGRAYCGCLLHHVEKHVPFSVIVSQRQAVFAANPPSWVASAENACFTP